MASASDYLAGLGASLEPLPGSQVAVIVELPFGLVHPEGAVNRALLAEGAPERLASAVRDFLEVVGARVVPQVRALVAAVRERGGTVVIPTLGGPQIDTGLLAPTVRSLARLLSTDAGMHAASVVAVEPGDLRVTRTAVSAFTGTPLDMMLRSRAIDMVITAGVYTDGAVSSTARDAADFNYQSVVVADGCAGVDPLRHQASMRNHERLFGPVASVAQLLTTITADASRG